MRRLALQLSSNRFGSILALLLLLGSTAEAADGWVLPRTEQGRPDFQGVWLNATLTPMERPASQAGKQFLSEDEIIALETRTAQRRASADATAAVTGGRAIVSYNQFWRDSGDTVLSTGQTSLIVDPASGLAPIRPQAEAIRDYNFAHVTDSYRHMTVWDRCITRGVPGSMLPAGYNNAYRIVQTNDTLIIIYEMIHDVRIIPLGKHRHIDEKIKLWMGDSLAHFDGDTLVVETTNYNDRGMIASSAAGGRLKGVPVTENLRAVERFTRVSEDTIIWEVTITDPDIYTQPFTISMPLTRDDEYVMYEYACHEGNHAVANILRGGRVAD